MWDWENLYKIIANNIRNKRKQLHMSQSRLAEKAGLSVDTIKSVEQGRRSMSLDTFLKIADALQIAPQELINGKKELSEINMEFNARYIKDDDMPGRNRCSFIR
jgi:transcriptional regulator with XRE-family HTH domain